MIGRRDALIAVAAAAGAVVASSGSHAADPSGSARWQSELARIEQASGGRLGVAVLDTGSGFQVSHRGAERFPLCSTFKVLAAAAVLHLADTEQEMLSRRVPFGAQDLVAYSPVTKDHVDGPGMTLAELCQAALTYSDNTAGNMLLKTIGGPEGLTRYARSIGDSDTRLDRWETALNDATPGDPRDTTTPEAMLRNLQLLVFGPTLSPRMSGQLRTWLLGCMTGDARLKAGVPSDWRVGDKTGSGEFGSTNDVAVMWRPHGQPLIVTAYLTGTEASATERNATISAVGRMVAHEFA